MQFPTWAAEPITANTDILKFYGYALIKSIGMHICNALSRALICKTCPFYPSINSIFPCLQTSEELAKKILVKQAFPWAKLQACWTSLALTEVGVRCFFTALNGIKYQFQSVGTIRRMLYSFPWEKKYFWMSLSLH